MSEPAAQDTHAEQVSEIDFVKKLLASVPPLDEGQSYFLLPYEWYVEWTEYLEGRNQMRPSTVPVESLLNEEGELREELVQNTDYALVHSSVWDEIKRLYHANKSIERKVIPNPANDFDFIIEVYQFKLHVIFDEKQVDEMMQFSKSITIAQLKKKLAETFQVDEKKLDTRFLAKDSQTLISGITSDTLIGNSRLIEGDILFIRESPDAVSSPYPSQNRLAPNEGDKVQPFRKSSARNDSDAEPADGSADENDGDASESAKARCGSMSRSDISEVDDIMDDDQDQDHDDDNHHDDGQDAQDLDEEAVRNRRHQSTMQRTIHKYQPIGLVDNGDDDTDDFENVAAVDTHDNDPDYAPKKSVGAKIASASQATQAQRTTRMNIQEDDDDDDDDGDDYEKETPKGRFVDSESKSTGNLVQQPKIRFAKDAGLVGLSNLGNTCFMNSALQCLSNTPELRDYFMTDRYKSEINKTNVLGTRGALATEFAALIREMWSGRGRVVTPRDFKYVLGRHAPRFSGYQQHDSQELLTYLLDGIHEDLNRVKTKPYKEIEETTRPVAEVAREAWDYHTSRNSSIIVDIFHGQYKLRIECDTCSTVSYACDPFMYLQVPIPSSLYTYVDVVMMRASGENTMYQFRVDSTGIVDNLLTMIEDKVNISKKDLFIAAIERNAFKPLKVNEVVNDAVQYAQYLVCYELVDYPENSSLVLIQPCSGVKDYYGAYSQMGIPLVVNYNADKLTFATLCERIMKTYSLHMEASKYKSTDGFNPELLPFEILNIKKGQYYGETYTPIKATETPLVISNKVMCIWDEATSKVISSRKDKMKIEVDPSFERRSSKNEYTLEDCLSHFGRNQKLQGENLWRCPTCKTKREATKRYGIHRYPNVLIIQLKRFVATRYYREKIDSLVRFPIRDLQISSGDWEADAVEKSPVYDLLAVSNHMGGLGGGHYTAYGINSETQSWYSFNDSSVHPVSESQVVSSSAYVLFYRRRDADQATDGRHRTSGSSVVA